MLVLSRKTNESIQIGEKIRLTVTQVSGGRVRIGIEAPPEVRVKRLPIANAVVEERQGELLPS